MMVVMVSIIHSYLYAFLRQRCCHNCCRRKNSST
jgi:hypothetical protein